VCWFSTVSAALEIPAIAALPERTLTMFAVVWLCVEILAGLLPAVGSAALEAARYMRSEEFTQDASNTARAMPVYNDLLELLMHVADSTQISARYAGIEVTADGTIQTSQSVLAGYLGQAKSTVNARLRSLQQQGRIALCTGPAGTHVRLIEAELTRHDDRVRGTLGCPPAGTGDFLSNATEQTLEPAVNATNTVEFSRISAVFNLIRSRFWTPSDKHPPRPG
jgi:hypothetical protein